MPAHWKTKAAAPCAAVLVAATGLAAAPAAAAAAPNTTPAARSGGWPGVACADRQVPVAAAAGQPADLEIWGELCYRGPKAPKAVLLLVPGITYDHVYWDVPGFGGRYSYVDQATAAGYATFDVDPLGTGQSSHPASTSVTVQSLAYTMHQVVGALRAGTAGGRAFGHVVYVGHSLGSETGWIESATYGDVDALVATGALHTVNQTTFTEFDQDIEPASADPAFAALALDPGYFTTQPGVRGQVFYNPDFADPDVIRFDEAAKDVGTFAEAASSAGLIAQPPAQAVTQAISVPVLLADGQDDLLGCGGAGGADCSTPQTVLASEGPYYAPTNQPDVIVAPSAGHDIALAPNALLTNAEIDVWLWTHVAP